MKVNVEACKVKSKDDILKVNKYYDKEVKSKSKQPVSLINFMKHIMEKAKEEILSLKITDPIKGDRSELSSRLTIIRISLCPTRDCGIAETTNCYCFGTNDVLSSPRAIQSDIVQHRAKSFLCDDKKCKEQLANEQATAAHLYPQLQMRYLPLNDEGGDGQK
ncbi:hypothetical protein RR46_14633 [Papilio xuthus]|uniref:Uncharacterized protein n=1 Tax=Papilio xuthus TaxID=66420 RepID=A0A194PEL1_PAPXU|nr:hypothetical protein RR46_14633 [Papilio xuthus]